MRYHIYLYRQNYILPRQIQYFEPNVSLRFLSFFCLCTIHIWSSKSCLECLFVYFLSWKKLFPFSYLSVWLVSCLDSHMKNKHYENLKNLNYKQKQIWMIPSHPNLRIKKNPEIFAPLVTSPPPSACRSYYTMFSLKFLTLVYIVFLCNVPSLCPKV